MEGFAPLIWAIGFVGLTIGLIAWQQVETWPGITFKIVRATLQLFVFGYLIAMVIELQNPWVLAVAIVVLLAVSALLLDKPLPPRLGLLPFASGALLLGVGLPLAFVVLLVLQPTLPSGINLWLPLAGVALASASSGGFVAADRLIQSLNQNTATIETVLSLGGTSAQAVIPYRRAALRAALGPSLSGLGVVGLGTLPLFMAGELFAGLDPIVATVMQFFVLLLMLLSTLLTASVMCWGVQRRFFTQADQLRSW